MQEEINQKTFVLTFKAARLTGRLFKSLVRALLRLLKNQRTKHAAVKQNGVIRHGRQKLKILQNQRQELTDIEITDDNIKSFEKYAKKYNIDFALKADKTQDPPRWYVFFKAHDVKLMEAAFKEYTTENVVKKKPSVRQKLKQQQNKTKAVPHRERVKLHIPKRSETL